MMAQVNDEKVISLAAQLAEHFGVQRTSEIRRDHFDEHGRRLRASEIPDDQWFEVVVQTDEDLSKRATLESFIAEDGYRSLRPLTFLEVTQALMQILEKNNA